MKKLDVIWVEPAVKQALLQEKANSQFKSLNELIITMYKKYMEVKKQNVGS